MTMNEPSPSTQQQASAPDEPDSPHGHRPQIIIDAQAADAPDPHWLAQRLSAVAEQLKICAAAVSVIVVDDASMAALHRDYAGVNGSTDVLTFNLSEEAQPPAAPEGEIYICIDEARRRVAGGGGRIDHELLLYAVHGLLHLLGYDDHKPEDYRRMHEKEDQLLRAIGIGPVFAGEGRGRA